VIIVINLLKLRLSKIVVRLTNLNEHHLIPQGMNVNSTNERIDEATTVYC